jgi:hypothetical protein
VPDYRYELRRGEEVFATGHLSGDEALEIGEPVTIGTHSGIVLSVEPLLHERELRLVVQLRREDVGSAERE